MKINQRAKSIALYLKKKGIKKGDRVILVYSPGIEFVCAFFACLYSGIIAVPAYPPATDNLLKKMMYIITNCEPSAILGETAIIKKLQALKLALFFNKFPGVNYFYSNNIKSKIKIFSPLILNIKNIASNSVIIKDHVSFDFDINSSDIAFIQYTSGSTSDPKGVKITHGNLLSNIIDIINYMNIAENDVGFSWLPVYHDMGLIGGILVPIFKQIPLYFMSPLTFIKNPINWIKAMSYYQCNLCAAPNFAYELCNKRITETEMNGLNLDHIKAMLTGAEPINFTVMNNFYHKFSTLV